MISPETILQIVLTVPAALALLISLIVFLIGGYKRGLWRSLISLGITAVSALGAIVLSRVLAPILSNGGMLEELVEDLQAEGGVLGSLSLLDSLPESITALLLFAPLFLILCIIGKCICSFVGKKNPQAGWQKAAGMALRAVDAVIFALILTLPLYGTIGTYLPVVQTVYELDEGAGSMEDEMGMDLDVILEHPVVKLSQTPILSRLYHGISAASAKEGTVILAQVAASSKNIISQYNAYASASEENKAKEAMKLLEVMKEDFVEQDWGYAVYDEVLAPMVKEELQSISGDSAAAKELVSDFADMRQRDFEDTAGAVLDFFSTTAELNISPEDPSQWRFNDDAVLAFGKMLNETESSVALKTLLVTAATADGLYDGDFDAALAHVQGILPQEGVDKEILGEETQAILDILTAEDERTLEHALDRYAARYGN